MQLDYIDEMIEDVSPAVQKKARSAAARYKDASEDAKIAARARRAIEEGLLPNFTVEQMNAMQDAAEKKAIDAAYDFEKATGGDIW